MKTKVILLFVAVLFVSQASGANYITIESKYKPYTYEELLRQAVIEELKLAREEEERARKEKEFVRYMDKADKCYEESNWICFLRYSEYALDTGLYMSSVYFRRGVAYESLKDFKRAKKEYKKAKKHQYPLAEQALRLLKTTEKLYKEELKQKKL